LAEDVGHFIYDPTSATLAIGSNSLNGVLGLRRSGVGTAYLSTTSFLGGPALYTLDLFVLNSSARIPTIGNNFAVVTDGSAILIASATTATEIGYVSGVTSAIQTQFDDCAKLDAANTFTVGPQTIT